MWIWSSQRCRKSWEIGGLRSFRTTLLVDHATQAVLISQLIKVIFSSSTGETGTHLSGHHVSHPEVASLLMIPPCWTPHCREREPAHPLPHRQGGQLGVCYGTLGPKLMDHFKNRKTRTLLPVSLCSPPLERQK